MYETNFLLRLEYYSQSDTPQAVLLFSFFFVVLGILWPRFFFIIIKINNFPGDITDIRLKKKHWPQAPWLCSLLAGLPSVLPFQPSLSVFVSSLAGAGAHLSSLSCLECRVRFAHCALASQERPPVWLVPTRTPTRLAKFTNSFKSTYRHADVCVTASVYIAQRKLQTTN